MIPQASAVSKHRHRALVWFLAVTGLVSVVLLVAAMQADNRAARTFEDVNLSGSLRYRSLWIYGATREPQTVSGDSTVAEQIAAMQRIRTRLRRHYPQAVSETDPAWGRFAGSLQRTGHVDWQAANAMRTAADALTSRITAQSAAQSRTVSLLLRLGLTGLFFSVAASLLLLSKLRVSEGETQRTLDGLRESRDLFLRSINAVQEGYVVQGRSGSVLFCNSEAERLLGLAADALLGQPVLRPEWTVLRENGEEFPQRHFPTTLALETALPQPVTVLGIRRPDAAETTWLSVTAAPLFHLEEASPYAAVMTFSDITAKKKTKAEQKQIEEEMQTQREFQQALLGSLQSGIVACDAEGTLTLFNPAAKEFHGLPSEPLPPEEWTEHFDLYRADGLTPLPTEEIPLFRAFRGECVRDAEMVIAPVGLPSRVVTASGQPIYSSQGQKLGAVVAMHDVTARRRIERELARLAAIVESSEEAIMAMTLDGTVVNWNGGAERLYGYAESEVIGQHASVLVPPGETVPIDSVIPRLLAGETIAPMEVVRRRRDGAQINVGLTFSPIHGAGGDVIGLSCIARDITARRLAENALRENEARLRYLGAAAFEGIAVTQEGRIVDANPAFLTLYGFKEREQVIGLTAGAFVTAASLALVAQKISEGTEETYEAECRRQDGTLFQAEIRGRAVLWDGLPARVTAVRDVTERKKAEQEARDYAIILEYQKSQLENANRELEALATTDGLTGLKNHRTFQEKLAEEYARAVRYHLPLSLLLLDVDCFKSFNDCYGHPAGDLVLVSVAAAVGHTARDTDVAARYGGEEFVVILPQTDETGALAIAERLRTAVAGGDWEQRPITVSLGISTLSLDTPTPASMIACADKALYASKAAGRNRTTHGNPAAPRDHRPPRPVRPKRTRLSPTPAKTGLMEEAQARAEDAQAEERAA